MRLGLCVVLAALAAMTFPGATRADCADVTQFVPASSYGSVAGASLCPLESQPIEEMLRTFRHARSLERLQHRRQLESERRERAAAQRAAAARGARFASASKAVAPGAAPTAVKSAIDAANAIAITPYVWGGGHTSFESSGYDCSGAVSYALHGAGLLDAPLTSGALERYGEPGPGRWMTIYASADHAYAVIAGLRWDTVGYGDGVGPRWHREPPYPNGYVVRHPVGY